MEFVLGAIIIIVILLILGVSLEQIFAACILIVGILSAVFLLFFILSLIKLFFSKKGRASFKYLKREGRLKIIYPYYESEGELVRNIFPTDKVLEKVYRVDEEVDVRTCRFLKKKYVIDKITITTIILGLIGFSVILGTLLLSCF